MSTNLALYFSLCVLKQFVYDFFLDTLPVVLSSRFSISDLGFYFLSIYPLTFSFLLSSIVETFSVPLLGHRKSWLFLSILLISTVLLIISYFYAFFIENTSLIPITLIATVAFIGKAFLEVSFMSLALQMCGVVF